MSCLFESLGSSINMSAAALRHAICEFLSENPVLYDEIRVSDLLDDNETPSDLTTYVRTMRRSETWGSALEIEVFCRMYKKRVKVNLLPQGDGASVSFGDRYRSIIVLNWDGGHYTCPPIPIPRR